MKEFFDDPLGFVLYTFPWGEGALGRHTGPDMWQVDLLNQIGAAVKTGNRKAVRAAISSGHGVGKAEKVNKIIHLQDINRRQGINVWGDLQAGDYVLGNDGSPTKIINTTRYRQIPFYKVTFDDGSSVEVSSGHLWNVRGRQERRNKLDTWRTLSTQDILEKGVMRRNGTAMAKQWEIPTQGAAEYTHKDVFDAYTVGVWLGDGCSVQGTIASTRKEIWDKIGVEPSETTVAFKKSGLMKCSPKGMRVAVRSYGMLPVTCDTKFIADEYKYNSVEVRKAIVAGMLDSDGEVHHSGSIGYSSSSKTLVEDLIWMVRSLGGKAMMQNAVKKTGYKDKDGVFHPCKDCYRCTINFGGKWNPFTHTEKKAKLKMDIEHRYLCRWITSIEPVGVDDGMCITVEAEDHLYLANDFIVTHNSALVSWVVLWFMSTRSEAQIVVTANTQGQLKTKTWRELSKWHKLSINRDWFTWTATKFYLNDAPETWFANAIPWTEGNSEAFAGTHDENVLVIYDEASAIADCIWTVTEGAMTTDGAMWLAFGNPTRNNGKFYDCFHGQKKRWITAQVDSRSAKMTNKDQLNEWVEDYGEDSDFVRVRVRGVFPRAGSTQYIASDVVDNATKYKAEGFESAPLLLAVDVARFGGDKTILTLRQGRKVFPQIKYLGLDTMTVADKVADVILQHQPTATFVDGGGIGGGVIDRLRQLGYNIIEANSSDAAQESDRFANKRAEMWGRMRQFLIDGAEIPDDPDLKTALCVPEFLYNSRNLILIESKKDIRKRGLSSPDEADSLAFTFYEQVYAYAKRTRKRKVSSWLTV